MTNKKILRIHQPDHDEELLEIYLGDVQIASANHDEEGWAGMEAIEDVAVKMADELGLKIIRTYGDEG